MITHIKKILAFYSLFVCSLVYSQVREKEVPYSVDVRPFLNVKVLDKESGTPMEGATVSVSDKSDTLTSITQRGGISVFARHPFGKVDSVTLTISFLGYKKIHYKLAMKPVLFLEVKIEEEPGDINAIIIKGDRIAMIRHGDTTIYNASAFTTMEGSCLAELLKKLPGIIISDNSITAYGEKVNKILINGTMLFGSDIAAGLEMVRAEEVKKVRIYDKHSQDRLIEKDTLGRKERVVDIQTKKPLSKAQELVLLALGGLYLDNDAHSAGSIGGTDASWRSFKKDRPSFDVRVGAGHNYMPVNYNTETTSPIDKIKGKFMRSRHKQYKSDMSHNINLEASNSLSASSNFDIYSPTSSFSKRNDFNTLKRSSGDISASYYVNRSFTINRNSSLGSKLYFGYNRSKCTDENNLVSITDGKNFIINKKNSSSEKSFKAGLELDYTHFFKREGRKLSAGGSYSHNNGNGGTEYLDTMKTSTLPQWLTIGAENRKNEFRLKASYEEPILKNNLMLNLAYNLIGDFSLNKKLALDELLKLKDVINTHDFTHKDITNEAAAGFRWMTLQKSLDLSASLRYIVSARLRNEHFPNELNYPMKYDHISPQLLFRFSKNGITVNGSYSENMQIPSIEQTRNIIDNSSSIYLRAGNPLLKASRHRMASALFSINSVKSGSNYIFQLNYSNIAGSIVNKTIYFDSDTYLSNYGYTALSGASLTIPINIDGNSIFNASALWNTYSNVLKSSFNTNINYAYSNLPFLIGSRIIGKKHREINLSMGVNSGFSRYIEVMCDISGALVRELQDESIFFDAGLISTLLNIKIDFLKHFRISSDFYYYLYRTTLSEQGYENIRWNMDLSYRFGKKSESEIVFSCRDILNKSNNIMNFVLDNYSRTSYNTIFGRSLILSYRYRFR